MESSVRILLRPYLSLFILVPISAGADRESLREIVTDINRTQVAEDEVLADSVYYYSRKSDRLVWIS